MRNLARRCRHLLLVSLTLLQAACGAGWRATTVEPGAMPAPQQYFQLWIRGRSYALRRVAVYPDSISGVPHLKSADCTTCRVSYARASIDSIRVGNPDAGIARGVAIGAAAFVVGTLILCTRGYCTAD